MKKLRKLLIGLAGLSLSVGAAIGVGLNADKGASEAKADTVEYYLTGSWTGQDWATSGAGVIPFQAHNENEVKILGHAFTGNNTFKVIKYVNGEFNSYMGGVTGTGDGDNQISSRSGINVYAFNTNAGIHFNNNDSTNDFNIYYNFSTNHYYIDYAYKLTVDETNYWMERHNGGEQYKATFTPAAGDGISITKYDRSAETLYPQEKASNNITTGKTVKVGGSPVTIYQDSLSHSTWMTGYVPEERTTLQDFCDAIIGASCDAAGLAGVGNSSAFTNLTAQDKTDFNKATVTLGNGLTYSDYGNVVNEAATRYCVLLQHGGEALSGITIAPQSRVVPAAIEANSSNSNTALIAIITISAISLLAVGGYFFIRSKKEDR